MTTLLKDLKSTHNMHKFIEHVYMKSKLYRNMKEHNKDFDVQLDFLPHLSINQREFLNDLTNKLHFLISPEFIGDCGQPDYHGFYLFLFANLDHLNFFMFDITLQEIVDNLRCLPNSLIYQTNMHKSRQKLIDLLIALRCSNKHHTIIGTIKEIIDEHDQGYYN